MTLNLYNVTCQPNVVDKTPYLHYITQTDFNLPEKFDIDNIEIMLPSSITNLLDFPNYATIDELIRAYFIEKYVYHGEYVTLSLHCDVLYTFRGAITSTESFARNIYMENINNHISLSSNTATRIGQTVEKYSFNAINFNTANPTTILISLKGTGAKNV